MDAVGTTVKEKRNTWNTSCKESAKRETELYKIVEGAVMDEKQREKGMTETCLGSFEKKKGRDKKLDRRNATLVDAQN